MTVIKIEDVPVVVLEIDRIGKPLAVEPGDVRARQPDELGGGRSHVGVQRAAGEADGLIEEMLVHREPRADATELAAERAGLGDAVGRAER